MQSTLVYTHPTGEHLRRALDDARFSGRRTGANTDYRTGVGAILMLAAVASAVFAADVASKAAARRLPARGVGHPSLGLRHLVNRRGSLLGLPTTGALALLAVVAAMVLLVAARSNAGPAVAAGLGLALGGAAGNVVDRARRGGVVDFVVVGRWPPFNLADVTLVAGVFLTSVGVIA